MKIQKKVRHKMTLKKTIICFGAIFVCLLARTISFGVSSGLSETEKQGYKEDMARINALEKSFSLGQVNNLDEYEKFADELQSKWTQKNKEYYARLMWEVCKPLSSGRFDDERQHDVARRYALSALLVANEIPLEVELELTGHVMTETVTPRSPKGEDFAQRRKKDVEIRLHAWKRLIDAIDPNWDPNDKAVRNVSPPIETGLPSGVAPETIKDTNLRAEYEEVIDKNRQKAERYLEQSRLHDWLKRFPKRAEQYIIKAYSKPPFDVEELKQYLKEYIADDKTRARILSAVMDNMQKQTPKAGDIVVR
jgi:hypothetical protein